MLAAELGDGRSSRSPVTFDVFDPGDEEEERRSAALVVTHSAYDPEIGPAPNPRLTFCAVIALALPIPPLFLGYVGDGATILVLTLSKRWRTAFPVMLCAQIVFLSSQAMLSQLPGVKISVTWTHLYVAVISIWVSALPWIHERPSLWIQGSLLLFPLSLLLVKASTPYTVKAFRALTWASVFWMVPCFVTWILVLLIGRPADNDFTLSPVNETCVANRQHVRDAEGCRVFGRQEELLNSSFHFPPASDGAERCCMLLGGEQLAMLPGRCRLDREAEDSQEDRQFVCRAVWLPHFASERFRDMRIAIQHDWVKSDKEVSCSWGIDNLILEEPDSATAEVCRRFDVWARLQLASGFVEALLYFVTALLSYLRWDFLVHRSLHPDWLDLRRERCIQLAAVMFGIYFVALILFDFMAEDLLGGAIVLGMVVWLCMLIPMVLSELKVEPSHVGKWLKGWIAEWLQQVLALNLFQYELVQVLAVMLLWPAAPLVVCGCFGNGLSIMKTWHWTSIFDKMFVASVLVVLMQLLTGDAVNVGLSVLDTRLSGEPLEVVALGFIAFSIVFFCIPALPGPVLYMGAGMVLAPQMRRDDWQTWPTRFAIIGIALFGKLVGTCIQMQIGVFFGRSMRVRYLIGLHTPLMRAADLILRRPGFDLGKVMLMIAGPDWPTGVFMGILGLRPWYVLFWTTPVVGVIAPFAVAGALLQYMGTSDPLGTVSQGCLVFGTVLQTSLILLMTRAVARATVEHKAILEIRSPSISALEDIQAREDTERERLRRQIRWQVLPCPIRLLIFLAAAFSLVVCWAMGVAKSRCFNSFKLGSDFQAPLAEGGLNGNFFNLFTELGWEMLLLLAVASLLYGAFWLLAVPLLPERRELQVPMPSPTGDVEIRDRGSEPGLPRVAEGDRRSGVVV